MAKILSFFCHKGGVGKTTLAYNVAWGLSMQGKHVLMIDADAQCNLTEITVDSSYLFEDETQRTLPYNSEYFLQNNIYKYFSPYIQPTPGQNIPDVDIFEKKENLKLLSGSVRFAELEETISLSVGGITALNHVPMSTFNALQRLSENVDYVIIDLSPALSATNQLFLMLHAILL